MYMVVSYDIEDDKRRGRIHRTLKSFGQWVQYGKSGSRRRRCLGGIIAPRGGWSPRERSWWQRKMLRAR